MPSDAAVAPLTSLEQRVSALEAEMTSLKRGLTNMPKPGWLKRFMGSADGLEGFDEAMKLGREARQKMPPPNEVPA